MKAVVASVVVLAVAAACGPSAQQACDDFAAAFCSQNLACLQGSDLQTFETAYGSSQSACVTNYEKLNCQPNETPCPSGLGFDTGLYEQCVKDYQNASCLDVSQPGFQPASCSTSTVCH